MQPVVLDRPGRWCWKDLNIGAKDPLRFRRRARAVVHLRTGGWPLLGQLGAIEAGGKTNQEVDGNYEMDINGTVIKLPADKIDANLSPVRQVLFHLRDI